MSTTLQIDGRKRWRFAREPTVEWPPSGAQLDADGLPVWLHPWIRNDGWTTLSKPEPSELEEVMLEPGDVLCMPAGCWHEACARDGPSLALNLSFGAIGFADVFRALLEREFEGDLRWRSGPPPGCGGLAAGRPPEAFQRYLAARLSEVSSFVDGLDPAGPEISALWGRLTGA
jgi:hypothetical protein